MEAITDKTQEATQALGRPLIYEQYDEQHDEQYEPPPPPAPFDELDTPTPKQRRMADCGKYMWRFDSEGEELIKFTFRCGYMDCPICRRMAAEREQVRMEDLGTPLYILRVDNYADREKITREIGSDNLRWYPQSDHLILITTEPIGEELGERSGPWWEELIHTPSGRRKSGKLGVEASEEKEEEDTVTVHEPHVTQENISSEDSKKAYRATLAKKIDPRDNAGIVTETSLQSAITAWMEAYQTELWKLGGTLTIHRWIKRRRNPDRVCWGVMRDELNKRCEDTDTPCKANYTTVNLGANGMPTFQFGEKMAHQPPDF